MKRLLLTLSVAALTLSASAIPDFGKDKRHHIVCQVFPQGCVADGALSGQKTPLYYLPSASNGEETYWIFTEEEPGVFSIKNAKTGQFVTYDGVRADYRRYINMTNEMDGGFSLWTIQQQANGFYSIRNAQQTDHIWDVRTDSYMVGTYSNQGSGNDNQLFSFYDEKGVLVQEKMETTENGYDVTTWLQATPDALDHWEATGGWFMNAGAGGSHYNGEASTVAPFIENWHDTSYGPLNDCTLKQTLTNLPAGQYTVQADIIAVWQGSGGWWGGGSPETPATGVELFANGNSVEASSYDDRPERFTVSTTLTSSGELELGVRARDTNANWIAIDNIVLYYNGTEEQLLEGEREKVKAELSDYYTDEEIADMIAKAGNSFAELEALRKSLESLPVIDPLARAAGTVTIDGRGLAYAESLGLYLCPVPEAHINGEYTAVINYTEKDGNASLTIEGKAVKPGSSYTFSTIRPGKTYKFSIRQANGNTVTQYVTFTSLPVVKIYGSFSNSYSDGRIMVYQTDKPLDDLLFMKAKWRGGITNGGDKHKRNYHVKLQDAEGNKLERKFFNLRNDNSWILESCQVDMSRVRNRVLTDLWNDYSTPPYYIDKEAKALTGTRGQFVELILNDEYRGIYCMTENIDRKQMKLKKYDEEAEEVHGQLWKSKDWSYAVFMGHNSNDNYYPGTSPRDYNNWSESWDQYYVKYPDIDDVSPTDWEVLYNAVDFVCTSSDDYFRHYAPDYFDVPLLIDYYILMETILSTDNHGKNMFFACYDKQKDKKITFGVWDMDATCGQRWSDSYFHQAFLGPEQDYAEFIIRNEHGDYNLFRRFRNSNADDFNMRVRLRYRDLRQKYLSTESILNRFRTYLEQFKACGAADREYAKWNGDSDIAHHNLDFDNEMEYITDWFTRRMNYLDDVRFDIGSLPVSGIADVAKNPNAPQKVYNLSGQEVGTADRLNALPAGVYVVNGRKTMVTR